MNKETKENLKKEDNFMKLDNIFSSNMVFAANKPIKVYGKGEGEITVSFADKKAKVIAEDGRWFAEFEPMNYGGPYELKVSCENETVSLNDIYIGEVYLCAGQSNIEFKMKESNTPEELYKSNELLRYFSVDKIAENDYFSASDGWVLCEKETIKEWSAIGYLTGSEICDKKGVAVGIICCNQGASVIESWVPQGTFEKIGIDIPLDKKGSSHAEYEWNKHGALYDFQLSQVFPFSVSGVIWYQGESDAFPDEGSVYLDELCEMIKIWRKTFNDEKMKFVVIQIADYPELWEVRPPTKIGWKLVQQAQIDVSEKMENVATVISKDICETDCIHPPTKTKLAKRIVEVLI